MTAEIRKSMSKSNKMGAAQLTILTMVNMMGYVTI